MSNTVERTTAERMEEIKKLSKLPRIVLVNIISYVEANGNSPVTADARFSYLVESEDRPYGPRTTKIGQTKEQVDLGWITQPGIIAIKNTSDNKLTKLELFVMDNYKLCEIPFGLAIQIPFPVQHIGLAIRGKDGDGKYTVTAFPM